MRLPLRALDVPIRKRDIQILRDGEIVQQMVLLKDKTNVLLVDLGALLRIHFVDGVVEEIDIRPSRRRRAFPRMLSSVDFPAPDGPMMVMNSPSGNINANAPQNVIPCRPHRETTFLHSLA